MIDRIIEWSARNRIAVFLAVAIATAAGVWSMRTIPLDAIPDLSDTQVIVYSRWDRSPDILEDQVTYPIVTAMLGAPRVKAVRGFSDFGFSYVYIVFEEGTDIYWARTRTLEYLSSVLPRLPEGVRTELGPDATGVGWIFQYALVDHSGTHSLADLRSYQDWYLRYYLKAVPGVAEVAPIGGFVRQYQVQVDPNRLRAYGIPIDKVVQVVRSGNNDVGGRLIEMAGAEYMVRGRGYARSTEDLGNIVLATNERGVPVRVRDVGEVTLGPDLRRGVADLDGRGDVVGGIVVMRQGENALAVIDRVKAKLAEVKGSLPPGVEVVTTYDRSGLITHSIETLTGTLVEELAIVSLVILVFLWHLPSALIPIITIPVAIVIAFVPMRLMGLSSNIMSLGGIAIAVGAMVDAAIVVVEQTHKKLEEWDRTGRVQDYRRVVIDAVKEVGGPSFFALLVIAVSFLPVLTLEAQEGRLFKPLAYTKNLAMVVAAVLAITLDPAMRLMFTHTRTLSFRPAWLARAANAVLIGKIHAEERHPISRVLIRAYEPACAWALRWKWAVIGGAIALMAATVPVYQKLGSEFMPPLDEGALLYMPSTLPGLSVTQAQQLLRTQGQVIRQFPEVERVFGKAGRAETSTDPAPFSMMETVITLKPHDQWRRVPTWYDDWAPSWLRPALGRITSDRISTDQLVAELNDALRIPGVTNAWTMPIKARVDMLTTGVRTPVGVKIRGADIREIERLGTRIEAVLPSVRGTRSAFAERTSGGYFVDFVWKRDELARYGLSIDDAQMVVMSAVGGDTVTTTVEGRERYPVNVRYFRDYRSDLDRLKRVLVPAMGGQAQVPLSQFADVRLVSGPAMLRNEDGMLSGYVYVDVADRDVGSYVEEARRVVAAQVPLPAGYTIEWSGQYEAMQRVKERLRIVVPITLALVIGLLYLNTRAIGRTVLILLAVPFSAVGAIWLLYLLGYNMSVGVWVGLIALLGVDAETGVFMLLYLDLSHEEARREGRLRSLADLRVAVLHGAVKRIRPKFMTVATMVMGLLPIMWSTGAGADVMKRIAAPMLGGILTSFLLELLVYPAIYEAWKGRALRRELRTQVVPMDGPVDA
ncbi:cation transporter [Luteitalea sp. TBR-22]|uniref:efflux RND transporter permease subunit n=1 Tax=Luteitalea sp. TBR-22 TaxID=2802971 RepID=UPI001AFA0310|nr:CusA/CzcA family heavy metal efflux RND transporter [Luteitalea sp. TBR-22]BCS32519.1 cation transporter [Luteitalea sp. TBR-22]